MIEPNHDNIYPLLIALGDGELDEAESARLRQYLSCNPELAGWLDGQRRLTATAARVVREQGGTPPEALRRRIAALARARRAPARRSFAPFARRAVAALLFLSVGLLAGRYLPHRSTGGDGTAQPAPVLPAALVSMTGRVHANCSRLEDVQHAAAFPQGALAADVQRDLAGDHPWPDLRALGFRYVGAGPCAEPLGGAVHLLYRTVTPGSRAALSVFVERYTGQYAMQPNAVYALATAQSPFPTFAWRTADVAYVLVADDEETARKALAVIRGDGRSTTQP